MGPEHLKFGGGVSETTLNPGVLVVVLVAGILICFCRRKRAIAAFLGTSLLIPMDQVLLMGSLHFPMLRVLIVFGIVRILREKAFSRQPLFSGGLNKIDLAVILLAVSTAVNGMLLFKELGAIIYQLGVLYTVLGIYFLLRFLIRDQEDIACAIRMLAWIAAIVAVIMTYEIATGHSPYALLGGGRAAYYASLAARDDRFRAQGPFAHSILAGTFGAVLLPAFVSLWLKDKKNHKLMALGIIAATVITLASNSSTPILGYAAGLLALCMWPLRRWMSAIRCAIVLILVSLHMVMKAPVWNLIARIDVTGGSSGYHRYMLVDQCIRHFSEWLPG